MTGVVSGTVVDVVATKTARKPPTKLPKQLKPTAKNPSDSRMKQAAVAVWVRHRCDIIAVGLILAGILTAFGVWANAAGPLGTGIRVGFGVLIGSARVVLPVMLILSGIALLRGPRQDRPVAPPEGEAQSDLDAKAGRVFNDDFAPNGFTPHSGRTQLADESVLAVRLVVGALLTVLSVTGLLHIGIDRPGIRDLDELANAGGVLGWVFGGSLVSGAGTWGAVLTVSAVGLVGLVILTQISLRAWAQKLEIAKIRAWFTRVVQRMLEFRKSSDISETSHVVAAEPTVSTEPNVESVGNTPAETSVDSSMAFQQAPDWKAPTVVGQKPKRPLRKSRVAIADNTSPTPVAAGLGSSGAVQLLQPSKWQLPSLDLLSGGEIKQANQDEATRKGVALSEALEAHDVSAKLLGMVVGPTITRYELELAPGVKVSRVTSLSKDIALALASPDVRILAPIPGRQAIGIEVPNSDRQVVSLGGILSSVEARHATHPLEVAIGRDIDGKPLMMDLARMPHILIAGATGAGKSSCINSMLTSILMRTTPEQVRMILVDPKMVEMAQYENVPHLLTQPVTDPKKAANALGWACREMDRRYELLASVGVRDIGGYNHAVTQYLHNAHTQDNGTVADATVLGVTHETELTEPMPLILVVVDELADLMMVAPRDVEDSICRIAQKARAVGIHLVIATQRPSINVITGVIKANIPARLAFAVSSQTDSRVILDQQGAERLVGRGDMLLLSPTSTSPARIQGAWVTESEVRAVVGSWRRQAAAFATTSASATVTAEQVGADTDLLAPSPNASTDAQAGSDDELLEQAMRLVVESQLGSTSMLQRKLRVGFARAGRLMDLLEQRGVVGPSEGSKAREVLMSAEEFANQSCEN